MRGARGPRDYNDPAGAAISIALNRLRSTGTPEDRIGSVVFNPGGPGASGLSFLTGSAGDFPAALRQQFDMVSFDPRGVGSSTAYDCDIDWDDSIPALDSADDPAWADVVALTQTQNEGCDAADEALLPYLGTNNAARDLDRIREALGDEKLSYVGFSYGTRLAAPTPNCSPAMSEPWCWTER